MLYEKPVVIIYDEEVMNEIEALATSKACKCGNTNLKTAVKDPRRKAAALCG